MKLNPDDPRLTAYALGELPENERAEIEAELQQSPECREAVEEIRQAARLLSSELEAEPCPELSPVQKEAIANQLKSEKIVEFPRHRVLATRLLALAACILAVLGGYLWFANTGRKVVETDFAATTKTTKTTKTTTQAGVAPALEPAPADTSSKRDPVSDRDRRQDKELAPPPASGTAQPALDSIFVSAPPAPAPVQTPVQNTSTALKPASTASPGTTSVTMNWQAPGGEPKTDALALNNAPVTPPSGDVLYRFELSERSKATETRSPSTTLGTDVKAAQDQSAPMYKQLSSAPPPAENRSRGAGGGGGGGGLGGRGALGGYSDQQLTWNGPTTVQEDRPVVERLYRSDQKASGQYAPLTENSFRTALGCPLSTFSIDVDTASYANVRRFLNENRMPPRDAVRVEEMINYFSYHYQPPRGDDPFAASIEVAGCPWNSEHRLVRVGLKGREIARDKRPPSNFVFLIDVSGSMQPSERLPLIKQALRQLVKKMNENDRVAIVTYANEAGTRLDSTSCAEKEKILRAIDELEASGSTNGGDGIQRAYRVAEQNFIREGVNRVLLCTDGDFNVGITDQGQLVEMIQQKAKSGVFLTTLGVGTSNYKDALMQRLADKGNGNYHYLDSLEEAQKVLIEQMSGTLVTIAKDVKIQIEFNPAQVNAYRLIGYEKRMLRKEDFSNDAKDAGEIGAGHTVTALYEIVPAGRPVQGAVDDLKYQPVADEKPDRYVTTGSKELLTLKLRYKQPDGDRSRLLEFPVTDNGKRFGNASADFRFAAAVAAFGMVLRESEYKGSTTCDAILEWAGPAKGADEEGYRSEFLNLVRKASQLR